MRFAIDRFSIGSEKEVCADDFDGQRYIPGRQSRFYCPECGENVYFRAKGGNNPNHFFHQERTDGTPDCDRRVDGRSSLSLNERVGLPLYLTTLIPGLYQLGIGFPALGSEMLSQAVNANFKVKISFSNNYRVVPVDFVHFLEDELSLIPVDFIPYSGKNYSIEISGDKTITGLHRKWSDYADGFDIDGAVFSFDDLYGKKIRRGDNITTFRSYYIVTGNNLPHFNGMKREKLGDLKIGRTTYDVLKIEICVSIDDKEEFSRIGDFFKHHFGVWLLETSPEVIPIWPPVVQQDCLIPVANKTNIICAVSSGNTTPNIYVYSEYGVMRKEPDKEYNGIKVVEFSVEKNPIIVSVDRKYVGREVSFMTKKIPQRRSQYEFHIGIDSQEKIPLDELDMNSLTPKFTFHSNGKVEVFVGSKNKIYRHISIREKITEIVDQKNIEELYIVAETSIVKKILCPSTKSQKEDIEAIAERIINLRRTKMVPVPRWIDHTLRMLKNTHYFRLYEAVRSTIYNGRLPDEVLRVLREMRLDNKIVKQ